MLPWPEDQRESGGTNEDFNVHRRDQGTEGRKASLNIAPVGCRCQPNGPGGGRRRLVKFGTPVRPRLPTGRSASCRCWCPVPLIHVHRLPRAFAGALRTAVGASTGAFSGLGSL